MVNMPFSISGYGVSLMDVSVSAVTNTVAYDALGRAISHTDGRGNTTRTEYNALGLQSASIDALGNRTAYAYDRFGNLAAVTDPLGHSTVYEYDLRGRKVYEGGASYPVRYAYDVFGNKTSVATFRDELSGTNFCDVTKWLYDEASNCMTNCILSDGSGPVYGYTPAGKPSRRKWKQGIVTDYVSNGWNDLTNKVYSDDTPSVAIVYDAFGRQTETRDAAGNTAFLYDAFGACTNEMVVGAVTTNTIERYWDQNGRTKGYALDGMRQTTVVYDDVTGRISSMVANSGTNSFVWSHLASSDLKSQLSYPNGLVATWQHDANGRILCVSNAATTNIISQYGYTYDAAGQCVRVERSGCAMFEDRVDMYGYNARGELLRGEKVAVSQTCETECIYQYDDIGNRMSAFEHGTNYIYDVNALNQYTAITSKVIGSAMPSGSFEPEFDSDGNQTRVKTTTGIWSVAYNGENRPILWSCGSTNITMSFDCMGRRVEYIETVVGEQTFIAVTNAHYRFAYDGYLCIQRVDGTLNSAEVLTFVWDPTEAVATRPLLMQCVPSLENFYYTQDGNKNVSELICAEQTCGIAEHYEYEPFGGLNTSRGVQPNPFRFSSEYSDDALGTVYYNFRHYEPLHGRWLTRDVVDLRRVLNPFLYCRNNSLSYIDRLGALAEDGLSECGMVYSSRDGFNTGALAGIGKMITDLVDKGREFAEIAPSIIDGQAFSDLNKDDNPFEAHSATCRFNITVNGMGNHNGDYLRNLVYEWLKDEIAYPDPVVVAVHNPNKYNLLAHLNKDAPSLGDVVQSVLYELKIDDAVVKALAKRIEQANSQARKNGCKNPCIVVYAHSQGTAVAYRAFERLHGSNANALHNVVYCGYGGQECLYKWTVNRLGLSDQSRNFTNFWDFMNWLNPRHWTHNSKEGTMKDFPLSGHSRTHASEDYFEKK